MKQPMNPCRGRMALRQMGDATGNTNAMKPETHWLKNIVITMIPIQLLG